MKMRHELTAARYKRDDIFRKKVGLNGRNAITLHTLHLLQLLDQPVKILFMLLSPLRSFSKIAQVHTRQHNLLHTFFSQLPHLPQGIFNTITPALASRQWNGTKRTLIIAPILYFQK